MFTLAHAATPPVPGLGHAPPLPGQRGQLVPRGQGRHGGHGIAAAAWAAGTHAGHGATQSKIIIYSVVVSIRTSIIGFSVLRDYSHLLSQLPRSQVLGTTLAVVSVAAPWEM